MAFLKNKLTIVLLCALVVTAASQAAQGGPHVSQGGLHEPQGVSHVSQGGAHENQGRVRRQAQNEEGPFDWINGPQWTTCDATTTPTISCQDCTTRLICKPFGGLLMTCHPSRPYCNNGLCSADPAEGC